MPAAWKNSAISGASGAPPETQNRRRPPRAARSFAKTSLSATFRWTPRVPGIGRPSRSRRLARRPTDRAQWKMRRRSGGAAATPDRIFAYTFSNTRGTLQMKCGETSRRFSGSRSMLSANAVVRPSRIPRKHSIRAKECASGRNRRCVSPSRTPVTRAIMSSAARWFPWVCTTPFGGPVVPDV